MKPIGKNLNNVSLLLIQRESIFWTRKFKLDLCTDTVISLYRKDSTLGAPKTHSYIGNIVKIEDRYIRVMSHTFYCNFCRDIVYSLYQGYIGVPLYEAFQKGKVDLNSVTFETQSIVQIECHSKHTYVRDSLFTAIISER